MLANGLLYLIFLMLLTFNVNPLQESLYAINWECSLGPDLVTQKGNFCFSSQWRDFRFGSAPSYLQDVCCTWHLSWPRGAVNFMQTPSKHSMPRARGPLSQRHHKSIHAKINHFHWTPDMREQGEWQLAGGERERQRHEEKSREKGSPRRGVGVFGGDECQHLRSTRRLTPAPFLPN